MQYRELIPDDRRLEDPFVGLNELKAEWVAEKSWTYRTKVQVPLFPPGSSLVLVFKGLDTIAHVYLNKKLVLEAENMFLDHRVDITKLVEPGSENDLEITFQPALSKGEEIRKQHPEHKWLDFLGETSRPAIRKAQYHWGWDWGPVMLCAGIWRPVFLEVFYGRIADVCCNVTLSSDLRTAEVHVRGTCEGVSDDSCKLEVTVSLGGTGMLRKTNIPLLMGKASTTLCLDHPQLWMPAVYGSQPLYDVEVKLLSNGQILDQSRKRIGVRKVELVQKPDAYGKSFYFRVNNVDIFCGGACWIPGDSFLTNIGPERYRRWITMMVEGNQNMIR